MFWKRGSECAAPPEASNVTATRTSATQFNLSWTAPATAVESYVVAHQTGDTPPADCSSGIDIGNFTSVNVGSLTAGNEYSFRICTKDSKCDSELSSGITTGGQCLTHDPIQVSGSSWATYFYLSGYIVDTPGTKVAGGFGAGLADGLWTLQVRTLNQAISSGAITNSGSTCPSGTVQVGDVADGAANTRCQSLISTPNYRAALSNPYTKNFFWTHGFSSNCNAGDVQYGMVPGQIYCATPVWEDCL